MPPKTRNRGAKTNQKAPNQKDALKEQQEEASAALQEKRAASKSIRKDRTAKKGALFSVVKENTQQAAIASVSIIRNAFVLQ